jgi:hypothetical protein
MINEHPNMTTPLIFVIFWELIDVHHVILLPEINGLAIGPWRPQI